MRRFWTAPFVVIAALAACPSAAAAAPVLGLWEAHGARGAAATFVIERIHGRLVLDHYVQFCQGGLGQPGDGGPYTGMWPERNPYEKLSWFVNRLGAAAGMRLPPRRPARVSDPNPVRGRLRAHGGKIVGGMPQIKSSEPIPNCGKHPA